MIRTTIAAGLALLLTSCVSDGVKSEVSRTWGYTLVGNFDISDCRGSCTAKISQRDGTEKCMQFTEKMAQICHPAKDKSYPAGTFQ